MSPRSHISICLPCHHPSKLSDSWPYSHPPFLSLFHPFHPIGNLSPTSDKFFLVLFLKSALNNQISKRVAVQRTGALPGVIMDLLSASMAETDLFPHPRQSLSQCCMNSAKPFSSPSFSNCQFRSVGCQQREKEEWNVIVSEGVS